MSAPREIAPRQRQFLVAFATLQNELGRAPTHREIGRVLGIASTNGVREHAHWLTRKGLFKMGDRPGGRMGLLAADRWQLTERGWFESGVSPTKASRTLPSFDDVWKRMRAEGYDYGEDALSNVRFGWDLAMATLDEKGKAP